MEFHKNYFVITIIPYKVMESQIKSIKRTIVHKKSKLSDCLCKTETRAVGHTYKAHHCNTLPR